ncbi:MAG TPA: ABC transporter ATP-binding protein [Mycobacteriales bacterium]|nr:ABC transporter ATP-binding protein [Mycobacteriales bacterium]
MPTEMPTENLTTAASRAAGWRLIKDLLHDVRPELVRGVAAGVSWQAAGAFAPLVIAQIIDDGLVGGDRAALGRWSAVLVLLACIEAFSSRTRHKNAVALYARTGATVRQRLLDRVQALDATFHDRVSPGELLARATSDADHMARLLDNIPHSVGFAGSIVVVTALLATVDGMVALAVVGSEALLAVVVVLGARPQRERAAALQNAIAVSTVSAEETLAGFAVIKGLGAEDAQSHRVATSADRVRDRGLAANRVDAVLEALVELLPALTLAAALTIGGHRVVEGRLSVGELIAALAYVSFLVWPMRIVGERVGTVQKGLASAQRLMAVFEAQSAIREAGGTEPLQPEPAGMSVELVDVRFGYRDGEPVLDGLSTRIEAGERVAVVGATASGKSTLLSLIAREYDADGGRVLLDGVDVRRLPLADLRRAVAVVGHDPVLFAGSVTDNVAFARAEAGPEAVAAALRVAAAADFVRRLPDGVDTVIGERGMSLSGGQRQRIAIARGLLAAPSVLLLDDATSALDATTEAAVIAAMTSERRDRTVVVVTHRPATLRLADRVVLIDRGRVIAEGTHAGLLEHEAHYRTVLAHAHADHELLDAAPEDDELEPAAT